MDLSMDRCHWRISYWLEYEKYRKLLISNCSIVILILTDWAAIRNLLVIGKTHSQSFACFFFFFLSLFLPEIFLTSRRRQTVILFSLPLLFFIFIFYSSIFSSLFSQLYFIFLLFIFFSVINYLFPSSFESFLYLLFFFIVL